MVRRLRSNIYGEFLNFIGLSYNNRKNKWGTARACVFSFLNFVTLTKLKICVLLYANYSLCMCGKCIEMSMHI